MEPVESLQIKLLLVNVRMCSNRFFQTRESIPQGTLAPHTRAIYTRPAWRCTIGWPELHACESIIPFAIQEKPDARGRLRLHLPCIALHQAGITGIRPAAGEV